MIVEVQKQLSQHGEQKPYFSITGTVWERNDQPRNRWDEYKKFNGVLYRMHSCGCVHEAILEKHPKYAPLVALHLSDMDGKPMHADANGYYYYEISRGVAKYHEVQEGDKEKWEKVLREHLRISIFELQTLLATMDAEEDKNIRRMLFTQYVLNQLPRWKKEAEEAIIKFELEIKK